MDQNTRDRLRKIYYDTQRAGGYGGALRLYRSAREGGLTVTYNSVRTFLADELAYSLHKPVRKNFRRNRTVVHGIDSQWQADLADMQKLSRFNGGNNYILTCIDVFSKHAWAVPVKDKGSRAMLQGMKALFAQAEPRKPRLLQTDKGKEFFNREVQKFLADQNVKHFSSNSDKKAAVVERFNRTLKTRIFTYFTAQNTKRYVDVLGDFLSQYNHDFHRSIGMRPVDVQQANHLKVWSRLYPDYLHGLSKPKRQSAKLGDMVRISRWKGDFEKGYAPNWGREHFVVDDVHQQPRRTYHLRDIRGEPIEGDFYTEEVQPIKRNKLEVEKILRRRKLQRKPKEIFVKYKGWPDSASEWINERDRNNKNYVSS